MFLRVVALLAWGVLGVLFALVLPASAADAAPEECSVWPLTAGVLAVSGVPAGATFETHNVALDEWVPVVGVGDDPVLLSALLQPLRASDGEGSTTCEWVAPVDSVSSAVTDALASVDDSASRSAVALEALQALAEAPASATDTDSRTVDALEAMSEDQLPVLIGGVLVLLVGSGVALGMRVSRGGGARV